jgi:Ala-tRNA(Pro) deacylase
MLVLTASTMVDFTGLRKTLDATEVRLASESEFNKLFPDCEVGAMPPFGNLFNVEVIVDRGLTGQHEIAFNAGNHREMIRMSYPDFERLVRPRILSFSAMQKAHDGGVDVA